MTTEVVQNLGQNDADALKGTPAPIAAALMSSRAHGAGLKGSLITRGGARGAGAKRFNQFGLPGSKLMMTALQARGAGLIDVGPGTVNLLASGATLGEAAANAALPEVPGVASLAAANHFDGRRMVPRDFASQRGKSQKRAAEGAASIGSKRHR